MLVSIGVIILRRTRPDLPRSFRVPLRAGPADPRRRWPRLYLMLNLPGETWMRFAVWMVVGVILYVVYGRRHSRLAAGGSLDPATAGERETARGRPRA